MTRLRAGQHVAIALEGGAQTERNMANGSSVALVNDIHKGAWEVRRRLNYYTCVVYCICNVFMLAAIHL